MTSLIEKIFGEISCPVQRACYQIRRSIEKSHTERSIKQYARRNLTPTKIDSQDFKQFAEGYRTAFTKKKPPFKKVFMLYERIKPLIPRFNKFLDEIITSEEWKTFFERNREIIQLRNEVGKSIGPYVYAEGITMSILTSEQGELEKIDDYALFMRIVSCYQATTNAVLIAYGGTSARMKYLTKFAEKFIESERIKAVKSKE